MTNNFAQLNKFEVIIILFFALLAQVVVKKRKSNLFKLRSLMPGKPREEMFSVVTKSSSEKGSGIVG